MVDDAGGEDYVVVPQRLHRYPDASSSSGAIIVVTIAVVCVGVWIFVKSKLTCYSMREHSSESQYSRLERLGYKVKNILFFS